ncbi:hypothetical protein LSCM1_04367 [Leishmania martiniquensis]|uniref:Uncharacterized protein n=1 Tax=Leishmania martiniquensis TaxID=1580590 RepID=A0A836KI68_9TRYP|nr:hypothetical protein LSCM1_04367 [Leishmania martiniquensis]
MSMLHRTRLAQGPAVTVGASISVRFKGLGAYDYPSSFTWPPPQEDGSEERGHDPSHSPAESSETPRSTRSSAEYRSHRRSPFSVLRSRQCRVGRCASGVFPSSYNTEAAQCDRGRNHRLDACENRLCCCSALFYPAVPSRAPSSTAPLPTFASSSSAEEGVWRARDDFLWSLKLASVERLLCATIGEDLYERILGGTATTPRVVLTCDDLQAVVQEHAEDCSEEAALAASGTPLPAATAYVARLLLSADEDNRIKWLQEESAAMEHRDCYARAPSLRALFVMWSVQQQQLRMQAAALGGAAADGFSQGDVANADAPLSTSGAARTPKPLVPPPTMEDIQHILARMEERHIDVAMADIAAIAAIGAASAGAGESVPSGEFWGALARQLQPQQLAQALATSASTPCLPAPDGGAPCGDSLALRHVLLLSLLLRYTLMANTEVPPAPTAPSLSARASSSTASSTLDPANAKPLLPMAAFEAASKIIQLRRRLAAPREGDQTTSRESNHSPTPPSPVHEALLTLCDEVLRHVYGLAERSLIGAASPQLPELTTWLLREMVTSAACEIHFKRLVDRSVTEALLALERSGLVNRSSMSLQVVVRHVLPLLENCGSEDLYTSVVSDVLSVLEEKARRDRHAFTQEEILYLSELGTKLFASGSTDGTAGGCGRFDQTARGQMEELHVMDGSPWALCVSSYRSLKEMVQGIIRDQRRLKQQVQEQLRQLSNSSTLSAVMTGGAEAQGCRDAWPNGLGTPVSASCLPRDSETDSAAVGGAGGDPSAGSASSGTADEESFAAATASTLSDGSSAAASAVPPRIFVSPMLRQRFLMLIEGLVKAQVAERSSDSERPILVSTELFAFVTQHVPVPNIQDEYRRKIFLLVNVAEAPETTRRRLAERKVGRSASAVGKGYRRSRGRHARGGAATSVEAERRAGSEEADAAPGSESVDTGQDPHGGANDIPAELRFLVSSLPLTLSPWASVMILREVLSESAGRNPRYTYVLNAAIDLQLPMSTTRSRIATTLNMWRFLNTQAHKLSLKESVMMKQRCAWNLPMAYVLSSYWSLLTWLFLASIVTLNVVGIDFESQIVANALFRMFAPPEAICAPQTAKDDGDAWSTQAAADLAADYFERAEIADRRREEHRLSSTDVLLSPASYLRLSYDDQRRPMTVIPIGSDRTAPAEERIAEEYAAATAVLRELSLHATFPFFVDIERPVPMEYVEKRIAERIRRVSFNNTWLLPRMIIRTFPLGRQHTEHTLVLHTCTQANRTRRRITFLLYMHDGVPVTPQFIQELKSSVLSRHANLVLVVHESSLLKGGTTPALLANICLSRADSGTSATIASAAAEMIEAVLPSDLKDSSSSSTAASAAHHMRVLPYCRQYYSSKGSVIPGLQRLGGADDTADDAWWKRALRSMRRRWVEGSEADSDDDSSASNAAALRAHLPLFASTFSDQRASLQRSRELQCKEAEDEAGTIKRTRSSSGHATAAALWLGRWLSMLSGWTSVTFRMTRVDRNGGCEEEVHRNEEAPHENGAACDPCGLAPQRWPHSDQAATAAAATTAASGTAETGDAKDGVSVSLAALRRLMSEA